MTDYNFNAETVRNRIKRVNDYYYDIVYEVPTSLKEDLDFLIEMDIGTDGRAILDDCQEEEIDGIIKGFIGLEFEKDTEYEDRYDYCFKCASQFDMLSQGVALSVE